MRETHSRSVALSLDQLVEEARQLPPETRAELVERIVLSHHGHLERGVDQAWREETRRRIQQVRSGGLEGMPLEESLARLRKRLGL